MARPREFDEKEAVKKALDVFRTQGYKAASMVGLTKAMGISRSSFYETFGSKSELFLITLKSFDKTAAIYNFVDKDSQVSAAIKVREIFDRIVENVRQGHGGCLYGNAAVEFSNTTPLVSKQVTKGVSKLENMFKEILEKGKKNADVPSHIEVNTFASMLVSTFYGLQVMAKAGVSKAKINQVITSVVLSFE